MKTVHKRVISISLGLVITLALYSVYSFYTTNTKYQNLESKPYIGYSYSTKQKFKITPPKGWKIANSLERGAYEDVAFYDSKLDLELQDDLVLARINVQLAPTQMDLVYYAKQDTELLKFTAEEFGEKFQIMEEKNIAIRETRANILEYYEESAMPIIDESEKKKTRGLRYIMIVDNIAYIGTGEGSELFWNQYKDTIKASLLTLEPTLP